MQNDDTFCKTILKLLNKKKLSSPEISFVSDKKLLHKVVGEDDNSFHLLMVPWVLIKCVFHQVHDALGHNVTARTYQCLK